MMMNVIIYLKKLYNSRMIKLKKMKMTMKRKDNNLTGINIVNGVDTNRKMMNRINISDDIKNCKINLKLYYKFTVNNYIL